MWVYIKLQLSLCISDPINRIYSKRRYFKLKIYFFEILIFLRIFTKRASKGKNRLFLAYLSKSLRLLLKCSQVHFYEKSHFLHIRKKLFKTSGLRIYMVLLGLKTFLKSKNEYLTIFEKPTNETLNFKFSRYFFLKVKKGVSWWKSWKNEYFSNIFFLSLIVYHNL